jgi:hypothetical protein
MTWASTQLTSANTIQIGTTAGEIGQGWVDFYNYRGLDGLAVSHRRFVGQSVANAQGSVTTGWYHGRAANQTDNISSMALTNSAGNWRDGTTFTLYGIN